MIYYTVSLTVYIYIYSYSQSHEIYSVEWNVTNSYPDAGFRKNPQFDLMGMYTGDATNKVGFETVWK